MSLYDGIISTDIDHAESKPTWSGIKLLENHLLSKKISKQKKEPIIRRPLPSALPGTGFQNRTSFSEASAIGALLGGDWDIAHEYDPHTPNDYEKIVREKREIKELKKQEELKKPVAPPVSNLLIPGTSQSMVPRSLVGAYSDDEDDSDSFSRSPRQPTRGAAIAPPQSLLQSTSIKAEPIESNIPGLSKGSVAAKIMARMGYKEGQGLGKEEQGIARALEVEKTSKRGGIIVSGQEDKFVPPSPLPPQLPLPSMAIPVMNPTKDESESEPITEIMKNPTKVVLLKNMVGSGQVDEDLEPEVKEECSKYGEVFKCVIYEMPHRPPDEAVRIFVEFKRVESAIKALVDLNGRFFGGRVVKGSFYDVDKFQRLELAD